MPTPSEYLSALTVLSTEDTVITALKAQFDRTTKAHRADNQTPQADYDQAIAVIEEAVSEFFWKTRRGAQQIVSEYEHDEARAGNRENSTYRVVNGEAA